MNAYSGILFWHERPHDVVVIQSGGVPLIGMGTLWGSQVILNAEEDGDVVIQEIASL